MRHKKHRTTRGIEVATLKALFNATKNAESKRSTVQFLQALLTESEQLMLGRRLLISRMLLAGLSHREIRFKLQVGPNTVSRVNKWLIKEMPEYGQTLKDKESESKKKAAKYNRGTNQPFSFAWLKKKYPLHFLLFNLADEMFKK